MLKLCPLMAAILDGPTGPTNTILKGDHPRTIPSKFSHHLSSCFRQEDFSLFFPYGHYVKTMSADGGHLG